MNKEDKNFKIYLNNIKNLSKSDMKEEITEKFKKHKKEENIILSLAVTQTLNLILMVFITNPDSFIIDTLFLFLGIIVFTISGLLISSLISYINKNDDEAEVDFKLECLFNNDLDKEFEYINCINIKKVVKIEKGDIVLFNRFIREIKKERETAVK